MTPAIKFASIMIMLWLLVAGMTTAQENCPAGLSGDDCAVFNNIAAVTMAEVNAFAVDFDIQIGNQMGAIQSIDITASGSGIFLIADGVVTAAKVDITSAEIGIGGMLAFATTANTATGVGSFVLLDDIMYFGSGTDPDQLTWASINLADYPDETVDWRFVEMAGNLRFDVPGLEWVAENRDGVLVFEASDVFDLSEDGFFDEIVTDSSAHLLATLGTADQIEGTLAVTHRIAVDVETGYLASLTLSSDVTADMETLLPETEDDDNENRTMLESMFIGEAISNSVLNVDFRDYNESFEVTAPQDAIDLNNSPDEMASMTVNFTLLSGRDGLAAIIGTYFSSQATSAVLSPENGDE